MHVKTVKKTKRVYYMPINKWTMLLMTFIFSSWLIPAMYWFTVTHPIRASYLANKVSFGYALLYKDTIAQVKPMINKATPKPVKKIYNRYNIGASQSLAQEVTGQNFKAPKQSLWTKTGAKLINIIKFN